MKRFGTGLILFSLLFTGCGMNLPKNKRVFIEMNSNVISNELYLSTILDRLNQLENQSNLDTDPLCILHLGDSHVQMGHFTNAIRNGMQAEFGGSELGIFFPYALCDGYNPAEIDIRSNATWKCATNSRPDSSIQVGITGATAQTTDSISQIQFAFKGNKKLKTVSVYHQNLANQFEIRCEGALIQTHSNGRQTAFTIIALAEEAAEIQIEIIKLTADDKHFSLYGVSMNQLPSEGIDYHAFGVSGNQYPFYADLSPLFEAQLRDLNPDLIILSLGSNDAYRKGIDSIHYQQLITAFITTIQGIAPKISLIITSPPDTKYKNQRPASENIILNSIRQASQLTQISTWDFHTLMGGFESNPQWQKMNLANKDGLHLTDEGYQLEGKLFNIALAKALKNKYPSSTWLEKSEKEYQNQILKAKLF